MKIFVDTNIFLDVLFKREFYLSSLEILNGTVEGRWKCIILDITMLNIDYIANKQVEDVKDFLYLINENFEIIGASNKELEQALQIKNSDLEDNLQYICAVQSGCDLIVLNDKNFYSRKLKLFSSDEFIRKNSNF